jgi:methylthioribose-1-phosphate isomerase
VCDYLATSRPTAVNLCWALKRIQRAAIGAFPPLPQGDGRGEALGESRQPLTLTLSHRERGPESIKQRILDECLVMLEEDKQVCRAIGVHGAELLRTIKNSPLNILTHCNAGSLATVQYGTALAPIYLGVEAGMRFHVYVDETRPLLQGSRLTAYELQQNSVPVTVLCDNMAASVLSAGKIDAVIVGADRIAANGDVANKIGTLGVAILARHFKVAFFVAAPTSTIDLATKSGNEIPIEFRDGREISNGFGAQTAPDGVETFNPAFDVTPNELVDAIITEKRVIRAPYQQELRKALS